MMNSFSFFFTSIFETFIQLQMNFGIHFILYYDVIKIQKRLMQSQYGTDTRSTMDIHGLLEMRGETRWHGGVSVYCLFECPQRS